MNFKTLPALLVACVSLSAMAADLPGQYATHMNIQLSGNEPFYRITVPLEVYLASARNDLQDLRVFDSTGRPLPYAILASSGSTEEEIRHTALRWFPLRNHVDAQSGQDQQLRMVVRQEPDGTLVAIEGTRGPYTRPETQEPVRGYVLDASQLRDRQGIRALTIDWNSQEGSFQLLDVEVSDNLQHWTTVASGVQLARLDYDGARIENRRIELSGLNARYLRLNWQEPAVAPELSSADIEQSTARYLPPPLAWSAPLAAAPSGSEGKPGEYRFHLPHPLPLTRLQLELPPGNQVLPIEVLEANRNRQGWNRITSTVAYQITSKGHEWHNKDIPLGGTLLQDFAIRIDPRLSPLAQEPRIRYAVQPTQVVFLASGAPPYTLATGNREATATALPVEALVPGFGQADSPKIAAAEVVVPTQAPPVAESATAPKPTLATENSKTRKYLLWAILVFGVLAMGAMAWQLIRQMKQPPGN